ncbi:hypothetical protein MAQ5080_03265 [Marinomonas aquimarina]|uniref:Peptidase M16 inactive domain protein n=1 Tax=Marinomonas aquimarina TaxID=295068 RepID=A0A1A8TRD8_9GAMM|nr:hypothetical protein [Marinomonas aquimarina]SBS35782.1 hypothetical protein MAQ5080_03265 [Marinomonas aquimarina]
MFKRDKPLFSRPTLAVIIVLSTLAVWLLNLTSPNIELETPNIEAWRTNSGIPVYWLSQDAWQGSDKVELAIVLNTPYADAPLTQTTLALLTGPTLPLSTATINQRLTPIAAQVNTHYSAQQQQINVTFSNRPQFLSATLALLDTWLNDTQFKRNALQRYQQTAKPDLGQTQLMLQLFSSPPSDLSAVSIDQLSTHLKRLKQKVSHIVISGALDDTAQQQLTQGLDVLTQTMQTATPSERPMLAHQVGVSELGKQSLQALYGAIGLHPLTSTEDWLALQIWAKDTLEAQKRQLASQTGQWQLHLAPPQAFVTWQLQVPQAVLQSDAITAAARTGWIVPSTLPSYQDQAAFKALKQQLLTQLQGLSQNPSWWRAIASSVALPNAPLPLEDFANTYSEAANSFTMEQYQQRIDQLLIPSSRQEVLIKL